ncbi:MAG TPA: ribonuclease III [Candidatus Limnocylindria bacterium]
MTSPTIRELGERLGLVFSDPDAISQAFVHASYANENPDLIPGNNERLEFLGDAVLGLIVSRLLYDRFPTTDEGGMTAHRASLVNRGALASLARELGLDQYLLLGRGELDSGGAHRPSLLAAAYEALIGAIYLSEGMAATEAAFRPLLTARLAPTEGGDALKSAKSRLQEWSQRHHRGTRPLYELVESKGPAHAQRFTVAVVIGQERLATGSGSSRQRAEERAARAALAHLSEVEA